MTAVITWILVAISAILCLLIVLQAKGNGLSLAPGSGDFGKFEKRGPEKILHIITTVFVIGFVVCATLLFFLAA
ncbi:MAG: preprotein translocase subunit SecG [Candidatus Gracilibacteria bacterium]|nr:preprotein translocase subunit SecG [Candidatus Gracilibacteria bacterium]